MRARLHTALATIALGFAVLVASAVKTVGEPAATVAAFAAVALLAELSQGARDEFASGEIDERPFSVTAPVHLAAILVAGPWAAAAIAGFAALAVRRVNDSSWPAICLRASLVAAATLGAGLAYELTGGHVANPTLPGDLMPILALAVVYFALYTVLLTAAVPWHGVHTDAVVAAGEAGLGVIGGLFAAHHAWNLLALVPVGLLVAQSHARLTATRREVGAALETFATIVDERDPSTYRHSDRVAAYVAELADALGLPPAEVTRLRWAGRLHDLGKVAVDAAVLQKPDRLTEAEWKSVHRAPRLSARLLHRFRFAAKQARAVEYQHERYDGSGYYCIPGDELPLASHFLIVADSFDAMTTDRPFRPRLSDEEALAEIERNSGTQFHPTIARAFVALRRGQRVEDVLPAEEVAGLRDATLSYRLPGPAAMRDLREKPELVAVAGVALAVLAGGIGNVPLLVIAGAVALAGLSLHGLHRFRLNRMLEELRRAVSTSTDTIGLFDWLLAAVGKGGDIRWSGLVRWHEHGLGGRIDLQQGREPPNEASLFSWLIREAEADEIFTAPGSDLGVDDYALTLPLRRDNSALVGFLVFFFSSRPPRFVEAALATCLDEIGVALADRPAGPEPATDAVPQAVVAG
jgi:HD-GYP domain-containing protein (c-di-GMP phosphodiesterase class II)